MESTPSRAQVVVPAILTFLFGLGAGVVVGYVAWAGRQVTPSGEAPEQAAMGESQGAMGGEDDPEQLRQRLQLHEALLEKTPNDLRLLRTVGNYQGLLGDNEKAMATYARAETISREAGDQESLVAVLTDQAVSLTEMGQIEAAFGKLAEAQAIAPRDTRSRLTHAIILMSRVMPNPPPGFERKTAVADAERLLREVLVIEPSEPNALELLAMISSVRGTMGGAPGQAPAAGGAPASGDAAPAGAAAGASGAAGGGTSP